MSQFKRNTYKYALIVEAREALADPYLVLQSGNFELIFTYVSFKREISCLDVKFQIKYKTEVARICLVLLVYSAIHVNMKDLSRSFGLFSNTCKHEGKANIFKRTGYNL